MIAIGSYANGFAPRDGQARYPELWPGCLASLAPCLGPTGLTLRDWSGLAGHGALTLMDAASDWVLSGGRYALDTDGSNDFIDISAPLDRFAFIQNTLRFTISFWQKLASLTVRYSPMGSAAASSEKGFFIIDEFGAGNGTNAVYISTQYGAAGQQGIGRRSVDNVLTTAWQHIAVTCNGGDSSLLMYINGKSVSTVLVGGTGVLATGNSSRTLNIGKCNHSASFLPTQGQFDDIRIYDRALSANLIALLAQRRGVAYELAPRRIGRIFIGGFQAYWAARKAQIIGGGL